MSKDNIEIPDEGTQSASVQVVFRATAFQKMFAYIKAISDEISGLGSIRVEGNKIYVDDVVLLEQEVSGGHTRLDMDGLTKFYDQKMQEGDDLASWKLWWHSHCTFSTFWSGIDVGTIEDFDTQKNDGYNWMLSCVGNHNMDLKIRLDVFKPFRYTIDDIPYIVDYLPNGIKEEIRQEIEKKVTHPRVFGNWNWRGTNLSKKEKKALRRQRELALKTGRYHYTEDGTLLLPGDDRYDEMEFASGNVARAGNGETGFVKDTYQWGDKQGQKIRD